MAERRQLRFQSLDEIVQDLEALLSGGYASAGNWNLSQTCGHLDQWMSFAMDGFPKPPFPINVMLWLMKVTVAKKQMQRILKDGFHAGRPTMPQTVPLPDAANDKDAVMALKHTIARFRDYRGEIQPSPLFGHLDRETAEKLQLAHCAHHLSFLVPNDD